MEALHSEEEREEYLRETERLGNAREEGRLGERCTNWDTLTDVMVGSAREVCGVRKKRVKSPWMIG